MRLRLATKFSMTIMGVLALALLSNIVALFAAWRVHKRLEEIATGNVPIAAAAEKFKAALLHETALVATEASDDGARGSLGSLKQVDDQFQDALRVMRGAANSSEERDLLGRLETVRTALESHRNQALALLARGDAGKARADLLKQVYGPLFREAYELCGELTASENDRVQYNTARAEMRVRQAVWVVSISAGLTIVLGGVLLWFFFHGIVAPLRGMVADAGLLRGNSPADLSGSYSDEVRMLGACFRTLLSDVADTRTSLERSRNRLLVAEKLASVGKLAASVAHEIRNPLTAMKMWLFSIQEAVKGNPDLDPKLRIVSDEISRLDRIVREFLEFSRAPALRRRAQDVSAVIDRTLALLAGRLRERAISVSQRQSAGLPRVTADSEQLEQVFINLLNNAADAMSDGGEIQIETSAEKDVEGRPMVVVRICDSGHGMPAEVQSHAFEPFFSTKESGTGLGLCIAARIIAAHDGLLVLESSTEKGTTFAVWTPVAQESEHGQDSSR